MNLDDIQAVIDSAKARDDGRLAIFVRECVPEATEQEVADAAEVAVEVIESVPILLARAAQAADERRLRVVVMPLLEKAARYFIDPVDLIPEMTQGLAGLLDDTYLSLRILENMNRGPEPLFDAEFDEPLRFLRRLVGKPISTRLDLAAIQALEEVSSHVSQVWEEMGHSA
ncbi:MAG: DUF1232 domain-containing protein [Gemmatimonadetes bacterium]|nr:DUF1232 domain-containing protein [Gemmatimonadota bacterium]